MLVLTHNSLLSKKNVDHRQVVSPRIIRITLVLKKNKIILRFLSDPSPIIGNPCHSLTDSLTHSCLVDLIDVTLAREDSNSKLVKVVTVADVDDVDRVGKCLLQIWRLRFGSKGASSVDMTEHL